MKYLGLVLLFGFISLGAIGGCGENGGGQDGAQTLTENDFAEDSLLFAEPDQEIVYFLESPGAEKPEMDTGEVGTDIISYRYTQTINNTICWEDDDQGAEDFMILIDSNGQEVLRVEANGDCVTAVIEEGEYEMRIHHDGSSNDTLPIFIEATEETNGQGAGNTGSGQGILESGKNIFTKALRSIGITQESRAQGNVPPASAQNVITLVTARKCVGCNLIRARLRGAPMEEVMANGADLTLADMVGANMTAADLTKAILIRADMTGATMISTILIEANMRRAKMPGAAMIGAFLNMADLALADLTGADLTGADLTDAQLIDTILTDADLSGATWTDGRICKAGSIGTCVF